MKLFKKLFKKKEKVEAPIVEETPTRDGLFCERCKEEIWGDHKVKTLMGKKYHLQCYRAIRKEAMRVYKGN